MGKIITIPISDKELIPRICKEVSQINHEKKNSIKIVKNLNTHFTLEEKPMAKTHKENA